MGDIFLQVTYLLSVQGNLVYHLVILYALYLIVLVVINVGRQGWDAAAARLALACGGAITGQVALIAAALLASLGVVSAESILPPLEHAANIISIGLLMWAFVPLAADFPQASSVLAIGNTVIGILAYVVLAINWYGVSVAAPSVGFNGSLQDWLWTIWGLALLGVSGLALIGRRRGEWGVVGAACAVLVLSYALHQALGELVPHAPGWVRLGNLVAYPLLGGVILRQAIQGTRRPADKVEGTPVPWQAIEACRRVMDTPSLSAALQRTISAIGAALDADVVAVGLSQAGERSIELAAVQQAGLPPRPGALFEIDSQPAIQRAVAWQQPVIVVGGTDSDQATLRALLGSGAGPLYIHPLVYERVVLGVLIAGRRKAGDEWNAGAQQLLNVLAVEMATALAQRRQVERFAADLAQREMIMRQVREEASQLAARLAEEQSKRESEHAEHAARQRELEFALQQARRELAAQEKAPAASALSLSPATPPPPSHTSKARGARLGNTQPARPPAQATPAGAKTDPVAYRNVFAEEAIEHLDAIRDALKRLKGARDDEALSQLFRLAHALESMATHLNYRMIARLCGLLTDAVKRVRRSELALSPELLALSEDTLHVLRVLLEDARTGVGPSVDVAPLLERWGPFMPPVSPRTEIRTPQAAASKLHVRVSLSPTCQTKAMRAMVILAQLKRMGKVQSSQPDEQTLRAGRVEGELIFTLATSAPAAEVQASIASLADVAEVRVNSGQQGV